MFISVYDENEQLISIENNIFSVETFLKFNHGVITNMEKINDDERNYFVQNLYSNEIKKFYVKMSL